MKKYITYITIFCLIIIWIYFIFFWNLRENIEWDKTIKNISNTNSEYKWFTLSNNDSLIIDYPIFINYLNNGVIENINKIYKIDLLEIKNIDGNNLNFISDINKNFNIRYYTFQFNQYNDDDFFIFDNINFENKIVELNLVFKNSLVGNNNLLQTFTKIKEISNNNIEYFNIIWNNIFFNTYKMSKKELNIIHSIPYYWLYIKTQIDQTVIMDDIVKFLKWTSIVEYSLYWKIKIWDKNIYRTWKNGEKIIEKLNSFN